MSNALFVVWIFMFFSIFVFVYTVQGLLVSRLNTGSKTDSAAADGKEKAAVSPEEKGDEPSPPSCPATYSALTPTWLLMSWYSAWCVVGGLLVGFIGIGIEKVTFTIATWQGNVHVQHASVTSITLTGWLSGIAMIVHFVSPQCPAEPGYGGVLPIAMWVAVLPGILVGSIVGPWIAKTVGAKTVMWAFCFFLAANIFEDVLVVSGVLHGTCWSPGTDACRPYLQETDNVTTEASFSQELLKYSDNYGRSLSNVGPLADSTSWDGWVQQPTPSATVLAVPAGGYALGRP